MAKKITVLIFVLWIAAVTSLCRGWGEEAIQDAMEKAKLGAEEAKKGASEAMKDAKDRTGSWADMASNKFTEEFGSGETEKNVKDGSRRMSEATYTVNAAADKARRYAFQKACELADIVRYAQHGHDNGNNRDAYEFIADKIGAVYDFASSFGDQNMKSYSRRAAEAARKKFIDRVFDAMDMFESLRAAHEKNRGNSYRAEVDLDKMWKTIQDQKENIIKMASENRIDDDKVKLMFGEDGPSLLQKYREGKLNAQETYKTAKETISQKAKDRYEEAKEKASQATAEFGRRIGEEGF